VKIVCFNLQCALSRVLYVWLRHLDKQHTHSNFFQVCHILLIVQEGSRFDPRYLRMFRTLQTAKHALAPFVKTEVLPVVLPQPISRPSQSLRSGTVPRDATGRSGVGFTGPQSSSMSSSVPVLYPGQCTPVTLFVCLEESTDSGSGCSPPGSAEDTTESSGTSSNLQIWPGTNSPGSTQSRQSRSSQSTVGSNRPGSKTEGGLRKKMQDKTEAQIRFLLKKCRTLASVAGEGGSTGSVAAGGIGLRGLGGSVNTFGGAGTGGALFALDQSRAVVFVDRASNRPGAGLEEISDGLARYTRNVEGSSIRAFNLAGIPL
jgi:protein SMG8